MDSEELIKNLNLELSKAENDLKVKSITESHLVDENEILFTKNKNLTEEIKRSKELIQKLESQIKTLNADAGGIDLLRDSNKDLRDEIETLRSDLRRRITANEAHSKHLSSNPESADVAMRDALYKGKQEVGELTEARDAISRRIDQQSAEIAAMKEKIRRESEFLSSKLENYRELLAVLQQERGDIDGDHARLQAEASDPEYKRQSNSLYGEVNDRRIVAELKVIACREEVQKLQVANQSLRTYLERVFDEYIELREEDLMLQRTGLCKRVEYLEERRLVLGMECGVLRVYLRQCGAEEGREAEDDAATEHRPLEEHEVVRGLEIEARLLGTGARAVEEAEHRVARKATEVGARKRRLATMNGALRAENAELAVRLAELGARVAQREAAATDAMRAEVAELVRAAEEAGDAAEMVQEDLLPPEIFGPLYINAKRKDVLVFDVFGRPIENRLTRRVMAKRHPNMVLEPQYEPEPNKWELPLPKLNIAANVLEKPADCVCS